MNIRSIKLWVNVVTIIALSLLVFFSWDQIIDAFGQMVKLNYFWLFLILPIQLVNYAAIAKFYKSYFKVLGERVPFKNLYKIALEINFVNNIFPTGGVSGFGYFALRMKSEGVLGSRATLTQVMRHTLTFAGFIVYLVFALLILSLFGNASRIMILISSGLIFTIIVGTLLIVYIISSSKRIQAFTATLPKGINKLVNLFQKSKRSTINVERIESLFERLHNDYVKVKKDWRNLRAPMMWVMLMHFTELMTIAVVYYAFGSTVNYGALIIAYAIANIAGLVAILPGGVGVYEGLMTAVMAASGIPRALALSATLVYRILNMLIFLPIGFVFYQLALRKGYVDKEMVKKHAGRHSLHTD